MRIAMANFSQLRRRQSSREILYRTQLSLQSDEGGAEDGIGLRFAGGRSHTVGAHGPAAGAAEAARDNVAAMRPRARSFRRQMSDAPDPDEMGSIMWEMRSRSHTSAGELKRMRKKERLAERERQEVGIHYWG